MRIAHSSAKKDGFGRPFFCMSLVSCLLGLVWSAPLPAQEAIYRCGQEYTNAPQGKSGCTRIATESAVTVIGGTQAHVGGARTSLAAGTALVPESRTKVDEPRAQPQAQRERDAQARAILMQELSQAKQQQAQLQQAFKDHEGSKSPDKMQATQAAIERNQRDIDSLQRELARRPVATHP
jgi:hypothetical protein